MAKKTREAVETREVAKVVKAVEKRLSSRTQNKVDEKRKKDKAADDKPKNKRKIHKLQNFQAVIDEAESRKRKFSSDIYQKAKALAESLPRGITVRPSGKWVSSAQYSLTLFCCHISHCTATHSFEMNSKFNYTMQASPDT